MDGELAAADRSDDREVAACLTAFISLEYCVFASVFNWLQIRLHLGEVVL